MARCFCGGMDREHFVGEGGCFRELVPIQNEPIRCGFHEIYKCQMWLVNGVRITNTTLREQRMYCQHEDGRWSKVKGLFSENSLPDET